ncbi:MAG: helix-turn-helix domain-containing protein [Rectinemataceae bacterium]
MGRGKSADATDFWKRYEESAVKDLATTIAAQVKPSTLSSYKTEKRFPRANEAVAIARALGVSVEYLVEGEPGAAYILKLVMDSGVGWHPPEKLKPLVDDLEILDDTRFASAKDMVHGLAELARQERVAESKQQGQAGTAG